MPLNFTETLMQPCPLNPITGNKLYSSPEQAMHPGHCFLSTAKKLWGKKWKLIKIKINSLLSQMGFHFSVVLDELDKEQSDL